MEASSPLLALFPESQVSLGRQERIAFDWHRHDITTPYVIFFTGRCGSTLLTNLIKDTQLAGAPEEYFNVKLASRLNTFIGAQSFASYLESIVQTGSCSGSFGVEIDWLQLRQLECGIDFMSIFPPHKAVFFYMTRRDIVAQAWSYATAKKSGVWQRYADKPNSGVLSSAVPLNDQLIWAEIILVLEKEFQLERYFLQNQIKPIRLDYEGLMTSRKDVLAWVLINIGCDTTLTIDKADQASDRILKIQANNSRHILGFRARYKSLITQVEDVRGSDYTSISNALRLSALIP